MANTYISINKPENDQVVATSYYSQPFTIGSWSGPLSSYYFITIPQTTHGKSGHITVTVFEDNGGVFELVDIYVQINASNDVSIRINADNDTRFAGKLLIA